ncbi:MAG: hypothetical protein GY742_22900 [Hyphomicrobiales bacterium]|nr:hypothetical protein [Hyphomicrobiales bacterium]
MRIMYGVVAFSFITVSSIAQAAPGHCWYYLHSKLKGNTLEQCLSKAESALKSRGYDTEIKNSGDNYISYVRSRQKSISVDILCYEVNGERGKVMSFITVAGNSACNVAEKLFKHMKNSGQ